MIDGKRYLIVKKTKKNDYCAIKLAYWFDKRITKHHTYADGFYHNQFFYYPYKNVIAYIDLDDIEPFYKWKPEDPIENEIYLVYRVGLTSLYSSHYTIRKYHNGSFGSRDVKYWIKLSEIVR